MNIAIIPARGGSKRIPRKNIKEFCRKPMIARPIQSAIESGCFDRIIVSTDDEEIAQIGREYGAVIPFLRPPELSNDYAGTMPVITHAIESIKTRGQEVKYACCIYATTPFVIATDLRQGLNLLKSSCVDYAFSVTSFPFPIQRAVRIKLENITQMFQPEHLNSRSQDLEEAWHDAGQFYWGNTKAWLDQKPVFSNMASPVLIQRHLIQDIDALEDWTRAEWMCRSWKSQP